jgi:outer membrane biosynthesis protein TonB
MSAKFLIGLFIMLLPLLTFAQTAESSFHLASNQYIHEKTQEAKSTLDAALQKYPADKKLNELRKKIKEEEKKDQQEQQKQEQQKKEEKEKQEKEQKEKEQQQKEQQQKEQQEKEEKKKEEEKKDEEKKQQQQQQEEKDKKEQDKKDKQNLDQKKLEQMKISEEKARMILEAMKNQEKQYLQQNKRKATKSRDRGKPDW